MAGINKISKPVIGVTGPDKKGTPAWLFTRFCIWLAGGRAVRITPGKTYPVEGLDGLVVGGGADVDPVLYSESVEDALGELKGVLRRRRYVTWGDWIGLFFFPFVYVVRRLFSGKLTGVIDRERDALEYELIAQAHERDLPVLGICRGAQLLNVYFGGSLYQDVSEYYVEIPQIRSIFPEKQVRIESGSRLAGILHTTACKVNGLHRQAVKKPGKGLVVSASEPNGVIQAVEHPTHPFLIGVQWHPEYLVQVKRQRRIFEALVRAASGREITGSSC